MGPLQPGVISARYDPTPPDFSLSNDSKVRLLTKQRQTRTIGQRVKRLNQQFNGSPTQVIYGLGSCGK